MINNYITIKQYVNINNPRPPLFLFYAPHFKLYLFNSLQKRERRHGRGAADAYIVKIGLGFKPDRLRGVNGRYLFDYNRQPGNQPEGRLQVAGLIAHIGPERKINCFHIFYIFTFLSLSRDLCICSSSTVRAILKYLLADFPNPMPGVRTISASSRTFAQKFMES